jgi:hypothetical protein
MPPYYTSADFRLQLLKSTGLPLVLLIKYSLLQTIVICSVFWLVYYWVLGLLGYDRLSALDEFFLLDNDKNRANIITVIKMQKIHDLEKIKTKIIKLALVHSRLSSKLIKFGAEYFFKPLTQDEIAEALPK